MQKYSPSHMTDDEELACFAIFCTPILPMRQPKSPNRLASDIPKCVRSCGSQAAQGKDLSRGTEVKCWAILLERWNRCQPVGTRFYGHERLELSGFLEGVSSANDNHNFAGKLANPRLGSGQAWARKFSQNGKSTLVAMAGDSSDSRCPDSPKYHPMCLRRFWGILARFSGTLRRLTMAK